MASSTVRKVLFDLNAYANVNRWYSVIARRSAVQRGYKVPKTKISKEAGPETETLLDVNGWDRMKSSAAAKCLWR
jgi:hypothetical protein